MTLVREIDIPSIASDNATCSQDGAIMNARVFMIMIMIMIGSGEGEEEIALIGVAWVKNKDDGKGGSNNWVRVLR